MKRVMVQAKRVCLVCEAVAIADEAENTDEIGTPCPQCHAPTERVAVLARRTQSSAANPHAAALGRLGGLKGGPARALSLSRERRREIARLAAHRRWSRRR